LSDPTTPLLHEPARASRVRPLCALPLPAVLLLGALLLGAPTLHAQSRSPQAPDLSGKVTELENKVALLESEVALLRDRLEALLGKEPGNKVQNVPIGESPVRGNPNAAITLVMFGDYQSDYTARAQYVVKRLLEAYPQRLRFVYKHYPLTQLHPLASDAALAALAAERQGLFWEYHDRLFQNTRRLDNSVLLVLAEQVGLDLTRFDRDRRSLSVLERLQVDEKLAATLGVAGLPTLYLNGRLMPTWRFDYLQGQIDKLGK
jgi:protein-disulfide isomerase